MRKKEKDSNHLFAREPARQRAPFGPKGRHSGRKGAIGRIFIRFRSGVCNPFRGGGEIGSVLAAFVAQTSAKKGSKRAASGGKSGHVGPKIYLVSNRDLKISLQRNDEKGQRPNRIPAQHFDIWGWLRAEIWQTNVCFRA